MGINLFNLITVFINCLFILIVFTKIGKLKSLKREYHLLKKDLDSLLYENSSLSTQYLDALEEKMAEGKQLLKDLTERGKELDDERNFDSGENDYEGERYNPITLEIAKLLQQGKSVTEIAEKLNTTKGEVVLRLNLGEKMQGKNK